VIAKVNIHGLIGPSEVDSDGKLIPGVQLIDVIDQLEANKEAEVIEVSIVSPGGLVTAGDAIYNYLISLKKKGKHIVTIQDGLVGSIATKIFLAGDKRIVDDRFEFFIHNPAIADPKGVFDHDALRDLADSTEEVEKDLIKFYSQFTTITTDGLDALMKEETGLTADRALKYGFATEKKGIPVYNLFKKMSKEKSVLDQIKALLMGDTKAKAVPVKAAKKPENEIKSMVLELADDAGKIWVESEDAAALDGVAAFLLDETGAPSTEAVPDDTYKLNDGREIVVKDGKIVMPATTEATTPEAMKKEEVEAFVNDAVAKALKASEEKYEAQIVALKKTLKIGTVPVKAVVKAIHTDKKEEKKLSPIQAAMAKGREKK